MQFLQPTHSSWSTYTIPSLERFFMAPVGHAATHHGFSQWKQGMKIYEALGTLPMNLGPTSIIWQSFGPIGNDLLLLH
jgi:hypothetical protein